MTGQLLVPNPKLPLIVISGPTASGKSALALELAERYNGEIICADSRTVYRGMDIGTAKPTEADQARVPHHLLDLVNPDVRFTAADFQHLARVAIQDIRRRGGIPFVVGGTGLYIDGLVLDYEFGNDANPTMRSVLEQSSIDQLQAMIKNQHMVMPENSKNKRYLIRALEQDGINKNRTATIDKNTLVVAITASKHELDERIRSRAVEMFQNGVIEEAKRLSEQFGWDSESMTGNIYPIIRKYLEHDITLDQAIEQFIVRDRHLAKRQITWLKRHDFVQWLTLDEAREAIARVLLTV